MRITRKETGIELIREPGDKAFSQESNVTYHIRRLLNIEDAGGTVWARCWPHKMGLTDCHQGVRQRKQKGIIYWHERYAIEAAHKAFNAGSVWFSKA